MTPEPNVLDRGGIPDLYGDDANLRHICQLIRSLQEQSTVLENAMRGNHHTEDDEIPDWNVRQVYEQLTEIHKLVMENPEPEAAAKQPKTLADLREAVVDVIGRMPKEVPTYGERQAILQGGLMDLWSANESLHAGIRDEQWRQRRQALKMRRDADAKLREEEDEEALAAERAATEQPTTEHATVNGVPIPGATADERGNVRVP